MSEKTMEALKNYIMIVISKVREWIATLVRSWKWRHGECNDVVDRVVDRMIKAGRAIKTKKSTDDDSHTTHGINEVLVFHHGKDGDNGDAERLKYVWLSVWRECTFPWRLWLSKHSNKPWKASVVVVNLIVIGFFIYALTILPVLNCWIEAVILVFLVIGAFLLVIGVLNLARKLLAHGNDILIIYKFSDESWATHSVSLRMRITAANTIVIDDFTAENPRHGGIKALEQIMDIPFDKEGKGAKLGFHCGHAKLISLYIGVLYKAFQKVPRCDKGHYWEMSIPRSL